MPRVCEQGEVKDEKESDEKDLYKGYTAQNALQKLAEGKTPKDKKLSFEYMCVSAPCLCASLLSCARAVCRVALSACSWPGLASLYLA
jgi:hypothetical protein